MSKETLIKFTNVNQVYPLFTTPKEMFMEFLGVNKLFKRKTPIQTFQALKDINLTVTKGKRIGIIGQNGAGKTTLLKLATGNYMPTSGEVEINGKIQSLMDSGLGFHQEFTGRENIQSSLIYNGLTPKQMSESIDDIIDFAELEEFIDQPIKTYSLGMLSRLGFATATAIYPEILIIDEIMGAGDAYFAAKSARRMEHLTKDGTTLLLVSHSTAQIIQFCDHAIWMQGGSIHMQGGALEVCKSYTKYMRNRDEERLEKENKQLKEKTILKRNKINNNLLNSQKDILPETSVKDTIVEEVAKEIPPSNSSQEDILPETSVKDTIAEEVAKEIPLSNSSQEDILPETSVKDTIIEDVTEEDRAVVRWNGSGAILIEDFYMLNSDKEKCYTFNSREKVDFIMTIKAQEEGFFSCKYVIATYTLGGQPGTIHVYNQDHFLKEGEERTICMTYEELLLGNGDYVVSLAIYEQLDLDDTSTALFYDLLDRSFQFKVVNQHKQDMTTFIHPAQWKIIG